MFSKAFPQFQKAIEDFESFLTAKSMDEPLGRFPGQSVTIAACRDRLTFGKSAAKTHTHKFITIGKKAVILRRG